MHLHVQDVRNVGMRSVIRNSPHNCCRLAGGAMIFAEAIQVLPGKALKSLSVDAKPLGVRVF